MPPQQSINKDTLKKWVLIVDDEPDIRENIRSFIELNFQGFVRITEAKDGYDASMRLKLQAFDCIITDLNMPRRGGVNFISDVRQNDLNASTPIIVLTGQPDAEIKESHVTLLEKPFEADQVIEELDKQFQLGRTDERISAELLNTFISAGKDFLEKTIKKEPEQLAPELKKPGEKLKGEHFQSVLFKVGKIKTRFTLGFDEKIINELNSVSNNNSTIDYKKLTSAAGQVIIKFAVNYLGATNVSVFEQEYFSDLNSQHAKLLKKFAGITIPLNTDDNGSIYINALWER